MTMGRKLLASQLHGMRARQIISGLKICLFQTLYTILKPSINTIIAKCAMIFKCNVMQYMIQNLPFS